MVKNTSHTTRLTIALLLAALVWLLPVLPAANAARLDSSEQAQAAARNPLSKGDDSVRIAEAAAVTELAVDDGTFETAVGLTFGGTLLAVNRLTPSNYPATLKEVKIFFRQESFGGVFVGDPLVILSGENQSGGDDIRFITLQSTNSTVQALNQFAVYDVPDIKIDSGDFVVGFRITHFFGQFPVALDGTAPLRNRSYVAFSGAPFTLIQNANLALVGNFGIRAVVDVSDACSYTLTPTSQEFAAAGGNGGFNVSTSLADCPWTATTAADWINITAGSGNAGGTVSFTVAANSGASRSASINVAGQIFTVNQAGLPVPVIENIVISGKKIFIFGRNFDIGARVFFNGQKAKKVSNDAENPTTLLISNKSGKRIEPGVNYNFVVENANGLSSAGFPFTRP
jgi:hypothetical protein